jgi:hypothetical protein
MAAAAVAAPNWRSFIPFERRVEWDARKDYIVHEGNGPWMILACTFAGAESESQARALIKELRTRYNMQAYLHPRMFDYSGSVKGKGFDNAGTPLRMRYAQGNRVPQFAVLVGNFASYEDPEAQEVLKKIKHIHPAALQFRDDVPSYQRMAAVREFYRRIHPDLDRRKRGAMTAAFVSRNPLLPAEYFTARGVDSFVYNMNKGEKFGLLQNRGRYTVRVATFRGAAAIGKDDEFEITDKLDRAKINADQVVEHLRNKGFDAYVFHDRHESVVTIGSYNSVGHKLPSGRTELLPQIHQIMQQFGADRVPLRNGEVGLRPKPSGIRGINYDVQPLPVEVPRYSISADYARR